MPLNKSFQRRIEVLDACFRRRQRIWTIDALLQEVNEKLEGMGVSKISRRSLYDDLKEMSLTYDAPIEKYQSGKLTCYRYSNPDFSIRNLPLADLFNAIKGQTVLSLRYKPFNREEATDYSYHPNLLKEYQNRWFIIGRNIPYVLTKPIHTSQQMVKTSANESYLRGGIGSLLTLPPMKQFATILLIALLNLAFVHRTTQSQPSALSGKVIGIKDGDTIEILFNGKPLTVRLAHIDCPEIRKSQPFGRAAKEYLSDQCFGHLVTIRHNQEYDRNKRLIGEVINEKGINLNKALVSVGLAWHYTKYSTDPDYAKLELSARMQRIGVWSEPSPVAPWEWRKPVGKNGGGSIYED